MFRTLTFWAAAGLLMTSTEASAQALLARDLDQLVIHGVRHAF